MNRKERADSIREIRKLAKMLFDQSKKDKNNIKRGKDKFIPISWDKAFDLASKELIRIKNDFGNSSIFAGSYGWASAGRFHHAKSQLNRFFNLFI